MSSVSSPAALPQFIATLLSQREQHVADIATIDATLARVTAALGGSTKPVVAAKPAPAKKMKAAKKVAAVKAAPVAKIPVATKTPTKSGGRAAMTAYEFVLDFIKGKKSATTQEINKSWGDAGRKGNADNALSQLTKAKKLKRVRLTGGIRGSQFSLA